MFVRFRNVLFDYVDSLALLFNFRVHNLHHRIQVSYVVIYLDDIVHFFANIFFKVFQLELLCRAQWVILWLITFNHRRHFAGLRQICCDLLLFCAQITLVFLAECKHL